MDVYYKNRYLDSDFLLENYFKNSRNFLFLLNLETGEILKVNEAASEHYGYTNEEMMNMTIFDIRRGSRNEICDKMKTCLKLGAEYKSLHFKKDGVCFLSEISLVDLGDMENAIVLCIVKDISEKMNLENWLINDPKNYKTLLEIIPEHICVHKSGKILFVNEKFADFYGYCNPDDLTGKELMDLMDYDRSEISDYWLKHLQSIDNEPLKIKAKNLEGKEVWLEAYSRKMIYDSQVCAVSIFKDITCSVMYEELNNKNIQETLLLEKTIEYDNIKTDFLSNVSHELRTPLNIILSSLQVLKIYTEDNCTINPKKLKNYLKIIKQNSFRLLRLVNNFLDITKIDSGFYKLNKQNRNIVSIVEEITTSVVEYLNDKKIDFIFDTEVEEKIICCDEDKIERIILNLLSNAIKFTEPGGNIKVNIYDRETSVIISIKDTGCGMPQEKLDTIFNRFIQVDNKFTREKEGSGIGLALVKSLVELHGGSIEVKSRLKEGTEFIIHLPTPEKPEYYQLDLGIENNYEFKKESNIEKMDIEFSDIYHI